MQVGHWGSDLVFSVNAKKQQTFSEFERETSARWSQHELIGQVPKSEFAGPEQDSIKFDVNLSAEFGIKPTKVIDKIRAAIRTGEINYLFLGGRRIGNHKMYIESMSESWKTTYRDGKLVSATVSLTFKEYV